MKRGLLAFIFLLISVGSGSGETELTTIELAGIFVNNTFQVRYHAGAMAGEIYHIFFNGDRGYTAHMQESIAAVEFYKTGQWAIKEKGVFCLTYIRRKEDHEIPITRCGRVVATGQNSYSFYDQEKNLYATLLYLSSGEPAWLEH